MGKFLIIIVILLIPLYSFGDNLSNNQRIPAMPPELSGVEGFVVNKDGVFNTKGRKIPPIKSGGDNNPYSILEPTPNVLLPINTTVESSNKFFINFYK